jgi:hypothetical protein
MYMEFAGPLIRESTNWQGGSRKRKKKNEYMNECLVPTEKK